jgi:hypothetical protein
MTAFELIRKLNMEYGLDKEWPKTYEVDAETYANCCVHVFRDAARKNIERIVRRGVGDLARVEVIIGESYGPMFKNVELILK